MWLWWYRHTRVEVVHAVRDSQCAVASRIERACVGRRSSIVRDESVGHERKNVLIVDSWCGGGFLYVES